MTRSSPDTSTVSLVELTEWFNNLDFDRSNPATRHAEYAELLRIVGPAQDVLEPGPAESKLIEILHKHVGTEDGMAIWNDIREAGLLPTAQSVPDGVRESLAQRLRDAAQTAQNDDLSKPQTEKRERHVIRIEAIIDAAEYLEELGTGTVPQTPAEAERIAELQYEAGMYKSLYEAAIARSSEAIVEACAKIAEEGIEEMENDHRMWREGLGKDCAQPYDDEIATRRRIAEKIRALAVSRPDREAPSTARRHPQQPPHNKPEWMSEQDWQDHLSLPDLGKGGK